VKMYIRLFVIGFLLLSLWATRVAAQDLGRLESLITGGAQSSSPGTMLRLLLKGIGLTSEQKSQVKDILVAHRDKLESLFQELQVANAALTNMLLDPDDIKVADVAPVAGRVSQIREQLLYEGLTVVLEVRQVLTPEQRAKAVRLREQLRALQGALSEPSE
jgi:Spy/CpxP family protein refolding chaperone